MVRNGDLITQLELIDLLSMADGLEIHILDEPFIVAYNQPWISLVVLPASILATCYVYPSKIEMQCADPNETSFKWYKGQEVSEVIHLTEVVQIKTFYRSVPRKMRIFHGQRLVMTQFIW